MNPETKENILMTLLVVLIFYALPTLLCIAGGKVNNHFFPDHAVFPFSVCFWPMANILASIMVWIKNLIIFLIPFFKDFQDWFYI